VFVGAGGEHDVEALHLLVAFDDVGRDGGVWCARCGAALT
jgi:hypothetical protein